MKIFNFSNGIKGELLDNIKFKSTGGAWLDGKLLDINSVKINNYIYQADLNQNIFASNYNVDAICYCTGKNQDGSWNWHYTANLDWTKKHTNLKFK